MTGTPERVSYRNGADLARACACVGPQSACKRCETASGHRGSVPDHERQFLAAGFGAELARLRKAAALSQIRLGDLAGLRGDHVGRLERGKRRPSTAALKALCRVLAAEDEREAAEQRLAALAGDSLRASASRRKQDRDNKHRRAALAAARKAHRTLLSTIGAQEARGQIVAGDLRKLADSLGDTVTRLRAETTQDTAGIREKRTPRRFDKPPSRSLKDLKAWLDARRDMDLGEDDDDDDDL